MSIKGLDASPFLLFFLERSLVEMESPRIRITEDFPNDNIVIDYIFNDDHHETISIPSAIWDSIVKTIQQEYVNKIMKYMCGLEKHYCEKKAKMSIFDMIQCLNYQHMVNGLQPYDIREYNV